MKRPPKHPTSPCTRIFRSPTYVLFTPLLIAVTAIVPTTAKANGEAIAIVAGNEPMGTSETVATAMHLNPNAIYLFRRGRPQPERIVDRPLGTLASPELSRDGELLAYCYSVRTASGIPGVGATEIPWVVVTRVDGALVDSIRGASRLAWSSSGESLAVIQKGSSIKEGRMPDTLVIWTRSTHTHKRYVVGQRYPWFSLTPMDKPVFTSVQDKWAFAYAGSESVLTFRDFIAPSDDHVYGLVVGSQFLVWEDSSGVELTSAIAQMVADSTLLKYGHVCWLSGLGRDVLAISSFDKLYSDSLHWTIKPRIALVDVSSLQFLNWLPGTIIGYSADREHLVIAEDGRLVFRWVHDLAAPGIDKLQDGPNRSSDETARIEIAATSWGNGGSHGIGSGIAKVKVGEPFGPGKDWFSVQWEDLNESSFRLIRVDRDGTALVDSKAGFVPPHGAIGPLNVQFKQRFFISSNPCILNSESRDGGITLRLRTL